MSYKATINSIPENPGIYIYFDFNGIALYVGKALDLKKRINKHLVRFNSSVIAGKTLDPLEITSIRYWLFEEHNGLSKDEIKKKLRSFEKGFIYKYKPKFNLSAEDVQAAKQKLNYKIPNINELKLIKLKLPDIKRNDPLERIKIKSRLIYDLASKGQLTGLSNKDKKALKIHSEDLLNISKNLNS